MFTRMPKDPFHKMLCRMFCGALAGLVGGLVMGIILGLLIALLDVIGSAGFSGAQMLYFAVPSMMLGAVLGAIFGGLFGTFRKE